MSQHCGDGPAKKYSCSVGLSIIDIFNCREGEGYGHCLQQTVPGLLDRLEQGSRDKEHDKLCRFFNGADNKKILEKIGDCVGGL